MASRLQLHEELCRIPKVKKVYFDPPESIKLEYPCIIYTLSDMSNLYANNRVYKKLKKYDVVIIDRDPDSELGDELENAFNYVDFNRSYKTDGLCHFVYGLYY